MPRSDIESQPNPEESNEDKENLVSTINVYKVEFTKTEQEISQHEDSGASKIEKLATPIKKVRYHWEGYMHQGRKSDYGGSSNSKDSIKSLAEDFSRQYMSHRNPKFANAGEADYNMEFIPSEKGGLFFESHTFTEGTAVPKPLSDTEQEQFLEFFRENNKKIAEEKKK